LRIRQVFGEQWLTQPVRPGGNTVIFAFKDERPAAPFTNLAVIAPELKREFGLDFPNYVQRLARAWQRRTQPRAL
jgi:hypothetical protein